MTYIFANDPRQLKRFVKDKDSGRTKRDSWGQKKKGEVKRSYSKLVELEYSGVIKDAVDNDRPLVPSDLSDNMELMEFVQKIVEFQKTRLAAIPDKYRKYAKYAKKADKPFKASGNLPVLLVAPYFPTTTLHPRGWHATNLRLVEHAKGMADGLPVFAVILADTQVLAEDAKQIAQDYSKAGADGFLLWPDGFSGYEEPAALRVVFNAVSEFGRDGKPVILMYGGAFSLVLTYAGLTGFACGICYGEKKLSTQEMDVEGAIPPRYYIRRLKKKVVIETELRRIRLGHYPDLVCNCDVCRRKPDPATQDDIESRQHFMLVRAAEIEDLRQGLTQTDFASALDEAFRQHRNDALLPSVGHLRNWAALL